MPVNKEKNTPRSVGGVWPVYVPSKGRPDPSTCKLLQESKLEYRLVIEPQEFHAYYFPKITQHPFIHELPENSQGIAFVRNWIKAHAERVGFRWYWMLDDDLKATYLVRNGKTIKTPIGEVLLEAQKIFTRSSLVAQGALEYQQFAWSAKKDHAVGYCDVAVCINVDKTCKISYRKEMELKEDRDFTLQVLASGMLTMRATHCAFAAPKNGSNKGGLKAEYDKKGREATASQRMVDAWPGICTLNKKSDGRPDVKINWKAFRP